MNAIRDIRARTLASTLSGIVLLSAANSYADVSQTPLSLTVGVPPNMLVTLDDSGSMRWAFAPDNVNGTHATRRAKSSAFNPLYFNPNITYRAPTVFTTAGVEQQLSTSYSNALLNGFKSTYGGIDLRSNYRFTWSYDLRSTQATAYGYSNTSNRLGENPSADFPNCFVTSLNNGQTKECTSAGTTVSIRRNNSGTGCTVSASGWTNGTCSYNSSTGRYTGGWAQAGVPAYYYTYDPSLANNCTTANDDCYRLNFVSADQEQNFANWYSFYRNRALATVSAAALAFYDLSSSVRMSWQGLGNCTTFNGSDTSNCYNNAFKEYSPAHKGQLYAWLQDINFNQGTPLPAALKRAGEFYTTSTPWQKNPNGTGNTTQNTYACRASYHILMTDGMWTSTTSAPSGFRHDAATFTLPDGRNYSERRPYYDTTTDTLADLAMHYWATDLNTNLDNDVPAYIPFRSGDTTTDYWDARNDPATWQHMTNFVMGLGLTASLNHTNVPWAGSTFAGTGYSNLVAGTANWPTVAASGANNANNVYDLWHAAINSRGEFFSVDSPEAMVQAFDDILKRIADRKSTAARPAINSGQVSADENDEGKVITVSYQTSYASDDNWSGDVKRFEKSWNAENNAFETAQVWSAESQVPPWGSRNIKIAGDNNNGLVNFTWANAGSASTVGTLAYWLNRDPENSNVVDNRAQQRLEYLRGNRSGEGTTFRQRSGVLGDFYSSTPAVVSGARYLVNVTNALENTNTYSEFATEAAKRTPRLYVGGNDGMLHAFNAKTGAEEFAFIPSSVFNKLNKLTGSNYSHEFYVDGTPVVGDVFTGTEWRTILVGTLKAGGKSIFALDITTPGEEKLLWEFDDSKLSEATVKMGYSFAQPTIARLHTGKWAVVIGNGYDSAGNTSGKAALFVIDALEGNLLRSLEVQGTDGVANGLSSAKLGDFNADGVADYAYAGDLQGNVWRFDLLRSGRSEDTPFTRDDDSETAISDFKVAYGGNPLFSATFNSTPQPITSAPSLVLHPTGTGYLVVFGTGKFFETGDKEGNKNIAQTVYGIWDKQTRGQPSSNPGINRSSLQQQSISEQTTVSAADGSTRQGRIISNNSLDWSTQNGWYLNLVQNDGEMVVENMSQLGRTIFMQSLVPNDDPCGDGAANWTYALNPFTGGRTPQNSFGYTPTGEAESTNISAIRQDGEGGGTISQNSDGGFQYCTGQTCANIYPDPSSIGRQTWRRVETED